METKRRAEMDETDRKIRRGNGKKNGNMHSRVSVKGWELYRERQSEYGKYVSSFLGGRRRGMGDGIGLLGKLQ